MKIALAICHRQVGYPEMWRHLQSLIQTTAKEGHHVIQMASEGLVVGEMRTQLVEEALAIGCEAVCFLDDDHVFPDQALNRLIAWDVPVVGALYPVRSGDHHSTALKAKGVGFRGLDQAERAVDGLVTVDALGMGLTLIRRDVFETLPHPWFRVEHQHGRDVDDGMRFCAAAKSDGITLYVDAGLKIGHLALVAVTYAEDGSVIYRPPFMAQDQVVMPEKVSVS